MSNVLVIVYNKNYEKLEFPEWRWNPEPLEYETEVLATIP
jgi:hypothetical protein